MLGGGSFKLDFKQGGSDLVAFTSGGGADLELNKIKGKFRVSRVPVVVRTPLFTHVFGSPGGAGRICTHCVNEYGINEIRSSGDAAGTWTSRLSIAAVCSQYGVP